MVFDTRTLKSFNALADVVGEYTAPGRSRVEMTDQQKRDACMWRYLHGWHAEHIAEALGLANANYAFNWRENVTEALEECALSDTGTLSGFVFLQADRSAQKGPIHTAKPEALHSATPLPRFLSLTQQPVLRVRKMLANAGERKSQEPA